MRGANGIATHVLEQFKLMANGSAVYGSAKRAKVVVVAHTLKLCGLAIQEEAFFGYVFQLAYANASGVAVTLHAILHQARHHLI